MNRKLIHPPAEGTYAPYYAKYIALTDGRDPVRLLESSVIDLKALLSEIPDEKEDFAYADGKWTVKELIGHVTDTERIMAYRALCIARGEQQSLPGFDENEYVKHANFKARTLMDIAHEFGAVREATIALYRSLDENVLDNRGEANNNPVTPRALLYIIAGHHLHHEAVLRERYLSEVI